MQIATLQDFLNKYKDKPIRFWIYKRMFTPYEIDRKNEFECEFTDSVCISGYIRDCFVLPDNDVLLGLSMDANNDGYVEYYKLSEIRLAHCSIDDDNDNDE